MKKRLLAITLAFLSPVVSVGAATGQVISLKCSYAIATVIGEMGTTSNKVMQEALTEINDDNGEFICLQPGNGKIYVRLQSTEMSANDNKLVFTINTRSYEIEKTTYGR